MSGLFPDAPGRLFAYDADGSAGFKDAGALTAANLTTLNSEAGGLNYGGGDGSLHRLGFIFPELRDIVGIHCGITFAGNGGGVSMETSADSTTGADGTWTLRTAPVRSTNFRTGVQTYSLTGVKAIRWNATLGSSFPSVTFSKLHVYGELAASSSRLALWHPTLDQPLGGAGLDMGDVPRSATATKNYRLKNLSATLTANTIVTSAVALTDASPTVVGVMTFDYAGGGYAATHTLSSLAPGIISGVYTLRMQPTASAALGTWRQRVKTSTTSWT